MSRDIEDILDANIPIEKIVLGYDKLSEKVFLQMVKLCSKLDLTRCTVGKKSSKVSLPAKQMLKELILN